MEPVTRELDITEVDAWKLAEVEVAKLPPYLGEDELTAKRLVEKYKGIVSLQDAVALLDALVEAGKLEKQERRNPQGGSHVSCYVAVK
jgi:hypothetical protein